MEMLTAMVLFAASTTITPGPNNVMLMASGLNHGIRKSVPHILGINVGFPVMVILLGFGLGPIFETFPAIHDIIKVVGVIFLLFLAWIIGTTHTETKEGERSNPLTFLQAALFQWANPKAWAIATGAIATFTSLSTSIHSQVILMAGIFCVVGTPSSTTWVLGGMKLKRILKNNRQRKVFNIAMALLLVISILPALKELVSSAFSLGL
jgi:threonine/homoserine/homoserine lactone efflux protein